MKIAALYDIHGNLPALEVVLKDVKQLGVEKIVLGGGVIVGPMFRECLDLLLSLSIPTQFILGNCEVAVLAQMNNQPVVTVPEAVLDTNRCRQAHPGNDLSESQRFCRQKCYPSTFGGDYI